MRPRILLLAFLLAGAACRPAGAGILDRNAGVRAHLTATREHPDSLKAWLSLGEAYRRLGSIEGRRAAADAYKTALRRWSGNADLLLAYGQLLIEQGFLANGRNVLKRVVRIDPLRAEAHFGLARLYLKDYRKYLELSMLQATNASLNKVLDLVPDHRDALFFKAFVRFQGGDTTGARLAINRLVDSHPDDPWGYLMLGMVAVERRRYQEAGWAMERGLRYLTDADEKETFQSLIFVDPAAEAGRLAREGKERTRLLRDFWKRRDPTPATEVNERQLEHYRRLVVAELYYGIREKKIRGWMTAPGEAIVRYGVPLARRAGVGEELEGAGFEPPEMDQVHLVHGRPVAFSFIDRNLSGLWLQPYNRGSPTAMDVILSREESTYDIPRAGPPLDYVVSLAQFRSSRGRTRIEMALAAADSGTVGREIQRDVALYDKDWNYLRYDVGHLDRAIRVDNRRSAGRSYLVDLVRLKVDASEDSVWLGSQLLNTRTNGFGGRLDHVPVRAFPDSGLCLSDLVLLDRVGFEPGSSRFSRPGGWGVPNPLGIYRTGENVPVYFEAYNLTLDASRLARYAVEIQVDDARPPNPRFTRPALIDLKTPVGPRVQSRFEEAVAGSDVSRLLDVTVGQLPAGSYRLTIAVRDLATGAVARSRAVFHVVAAGGGREGASR